MLLGLSSHTDRPVTIRPVMEELAPTRRTNCGELHKARTDQDRLRPSSYTPAPEQLANDGDTDMTRIEFSPAH